MTQLAGVRFEASGPVHYFDAGGIPLENGDRVLVETDGIPREGSVVIRPDQVLFSDLRGPMGRIIQKAER